MAPYGLETRLSTLFHLTKAKVYDINAVDVNSLFFEITIEFYCSIFKVNSWTVPS